MRPRHLTLGLWLVVLIASGIIAGRTSYRTDMGDFLPNSASMAQQVLAGQVNGGAASHIVLLAIKGPSAPVPAALSQTLAAKLRQEPAFLDVMNGDDQSFAGAQDFVWRNRYLLSLDVSAARFSVVGLHGALENDLALLGSELGVVMGGSLSSDPTGEMIGILRRLGARTGHMGKDGVWLAADGGAALLLVHTGAPGFDLDAQQQVQALIGGDFARARAATSGAERAYLQMTGPGVFALRTRDTTKYDVTRLSIFALTGAAALLAFAYRSPRVLLLGLLPIASGALAAIAAVSLTFGFVHGITLGFGVTLIGESLDYAIYLFTQTARGEQANETVIRIWPTLRLGALTSIAGFSAMLFSSFTGFAQLGLFSIAGLVAAVATTRFVLPLFVPHRFFAAGAEPVAWPLQRLIRHRRLARSAIAVALLAAIGALLTHRGDIWDENLLDLSPIPEADQMLDQNLRHELGLPDIRFFAVFKTVSEQQALQESEALAPLLDKLVSAHRLGGFDLPSSILPSESTQLQRQQALPDMATLRARFAEADSGLPFRSQAFEPFFADVAAAKTAPLLMPASLPPALALQFDSMLVHKDDGWVVMAPLHDVADPAATARDLAAAGPQGLAFVDLARESDQLLHTFQMQAVVLAVAGSLAIVVLLVLGLGSLWRAVAVAAPLAAAVIMTFALLTWGEAKLSIFMVAGFLLIIAIGSNYCLFFERTAPDTPGWSRTVASVVLANLCTVAAYGLLSLSRIPVLHDIGLTTALGTFLCLVCGGVLSTTTPKRSPCVLQKK